MTEEEWLTSNHFGRLYSCLKRCHGIARTKAGRRRLRLLACGCCRVTVWELPTKVSYRRAVEAAEMFADGVLDIAELYKAWAKCSYYPIPNPRGKQKLLNAAALAMKESANERTRSIVSHVCRHAIEAMEKDAKPKAKMQLRGVIRDIFGNPFRPVTIDRSGLTSTVISLAQAIYTDRAFDRLPILADALEDAGCTNQEILNHCRQPGVHVRGCWAVDLLLGRE
jgi:hypothetical protein